MNSISPSSSFHSDGPLPSSPSSSSSSSQPSARFLYNQAAQTFLLRQHPSTLDLLETLFRQLPRPKQDWTSSPSSGGKEGREKDREEVRRKAVLLWITCLACIFTDQRRAAAGGEGGKDTHQDSLFGGRAEDLYEHLVHRSSELFATSSSSTSLPSSSSSSSSTRTPASLPPLPPTIAHTLILTSIKLGLPSALPRDLVVLPFLTSLPPTLTSLLAAQSRKRETREGSYDRTRGTEGWAGEMLDGYEKVLEGWCVTVLGQSEGKVREATEMIGSDGVLGKAKKEELLQTLNHLPPLTPSPPANISLLPLHSPSSSLSSSGFLSPPPPRPVSPALSDASETTATPNNFRVGSSSSKGKGKESSRRATDPFAPATSEEVVREDSNWSYSAFTDRLRQFVAPRPAPPPSSTSVDDASNPPTSQLQNHPLLLALRSRISNLKLPASVLLVVVLAVIGLRRWWVRRGRVAAAVNVAAPRDVRSRLGKSILARILS